MTVLLEAIGIIVWVLFGFAIGRMIGVRDKAAREGIRELARLAKHSEVTFWDHNNTVSIRETDAERNLRHKETVEARDKELRSKTTSSHTGPKGMEFEFELPTDLGKKMVEAINMGPGKIMPNMAVSEIKRSPSNAELAEQIELLHTYLGVKPECTHEHKLVKVPKKKK